MTLQELIEFRDRMYRDPELLAIYEQGDANSHWQTRHDYQHGDEVTVLARELTGHIHRIFPELLDEVTREFVIPCAAWLHDIGRAIDIDRHDIEGARLVNRYLKKHGIPQDLVQRISRIVVHHRSGSVIKRGIRSPEHAIVVIADKCIGDENRVREDKAFMLNILKHIGIGKLTLARRNFWYNAPHDRVNYAIKEANLLVDVNEADKAGPPSGEVVLKLRVDERVAPIEEIVTLDWFADSFFACGKASKYFGFSFRLEFNGVRHMWDKTARKGHGGWVPMRTMHVPRGCESHEEGCDEDRS